MTVLKMREHTTKPKPRKGHPAPKKQLPLMELLEAVSRFPVSQNLPRDGAAQHDKYLYGSRKRS